MVELVAKEDGKQKGSSGNNGGGEGKDKMVSERTNKNLGARQRTHQQPRPQTPNRKLSSVSTTPTGRQRKLT